MPTNDFLPFGTAVGANVMTQANYLALTARSNGFSAGTAASAQLNKAWRQSSIIASMLAQFIADQSGQNAIDDGTTATLEANLLIAIRAAGRQTTVLTDTGAVNTYAAANTPALAALPTTSGYSQRVNIANANTGAATYAPDGLAPKPIYGLALQPLQGGELPAGIAVMMYLVQAGVNGGNGAWIIVESLGGASQIPLATKSQHAMQLGQAVGRLINTLAFTAAGSFTYTPTLGMKSVIVEIVGGGGGGSGAPASSSSQFSSGGGGGSGAYAKGLFTAAAIGASKTVTVGAPGTAASAASGGSGGTTSLGALMSAPGGSGAPLAGVYPNTAAAMGPAGGPATVASGGSLINSSGGTGATGLAIPSYGVISGYGAGSAMAGGQGGGPAIGANNSGQAGQAPGSGGSGGATLNGAAVSGGFGAPGAVIIYEFA